jgi:lipopolysaccharide cholinephosphotransferase
MKLSLIKDKNGIEYYTIPHLRELQLLMIDLLKIVDTIARKNQLEYWIDGGTLLGAVRHKGFIPWDDDIDICLLKPDYDKLLPLIIEYIKDKKELSLIYYKNEKHQHWSEILTSDKIRIEYNGMSRLTRIDIFPMKLVKNEDSEIREDKYQTDLLLWYSQGRVKYFSEIKRKNKFENLNSSLKDKKDFFKTFHDEYLWKNFNVNDKTNILVDYSFGNNYISRERDYKKFNDIFPLKTIYFEGYEFMCPKNSDTYLKILYGDYLKLPSLENRRPLHNSKIMLDSPSISDEEKAKFLNKLNEYFYYSNKKAFKILTLIRLIKSNGFASAYFQILKPFFKRVVRLK